MSQTRLYLTARKPEAYHIATLLEPALEDLGFPNVLFEDEENPGNWCYSIYVDADDIEATRRIVHDKIGGDLFGLTLEQEVLEDIDWVSKSLKDLSPVIAGRFFVHGSHDRKLAETKPVSIEINAGQAFGTGHHGTTAGCLELLEDCLRNRAPTRAIDLGTGSGVLAIALAKCIKVPILATDIDPIAIDVARQNARHNELGSTIQFSVATGFEHRDFTKFGKADLIMANILAGPLQRLAPPMAQQADTRCRIILSGLLPHQKTRIISAYRQQGFFLKRAIIRDGWLSLLMENSN